MNKKRTVLFLFFLFLIILPTNLKAESNPGFEADSLRDLALKSYDNGEYDKALQLFQEELKLRKEINDRDGEAESFNNIGNLHYVLGEYEKAIGYYAEALKIMKELGNQAGEFYALFYIGNAYYSLSKYEDVLKFYIDALEIIKETHNRDSEGTMLNSLGVVCENLERYEDAIKYYTEALKIKKEIKDLEGATLVLNNIANLYYEKLNRYEEALKYYGQSLEISREIGDRSNEAVIFNRVGVINFNLKEYEEALKYFGDALTITKEAGDRGYELTILINIANSYYNMAKNSDALKYYEEALTTAREVGDYYAEMEILKQLIELYKHSNDYAKAVECFIGLYKLTEPAARQSLKLFDANDTLVIPYILDSLKSADAEMRECAVWILGEVKARQAVLELIKILKDKNEHTDIRIAAAEALGEIFDNQAIPHLIEVMKDKNPVIRKAVIRALNAWGWWLDRKAVKSLREALKDENEDVRHEAAFTLGWMGDPEAIKPLIEILKSDSAHLRDYALGILAAPMSILYDISEAVPQLVILLKDKANALTATYVLRMIHDQKTVIPLIDALKNEDALVRSGAAGALGGIGDKQAIPSLIELLKDENPEVCIAAAFALWELGDNQGVPLLIEILKKGNAHLKNSVIWRLARIGDKSVVSVLIDLLKNDKSGEVRANAVQALGGLGDGSVVSVLIESLTKDRNENVRRNAVLALGQLNAKSTVPILIEVLQKDEDFLVRANAAEALGKFGDKSAVPVLVEALIKNKEYWVRDCAIMALGKIGDKSAVPSLIEALKNEENTVAEIRAIIYALKKFDDWTTILDLLKESERLKLESKIGVLLLAGWMCGESRKINQQLEIAIKAYNEAIKIDNYPFKIRALWQISEALLELDKPDSALAKLVEAEKLIKELIIREREALDFPEAQTFCLLGECYLALGKSTEALGSFNEALNAIEHNKGLWWNKDEEILMELKGRIIIRRGDAKTQGAIDDYSKGREIYKEHKPLERKAREAAEDANMRLISLLIIQEKYDEAQKIIEEELIVRQKELFDETDPELANPEEQKELEKGRKMLKEIAELKNKLDEMKNESTTLEGIKKQKEKIEELKLEQQKKQQEYKNFIVELKKTHPELASIIGSEPTDLKHLQESLPDSTAILQYLISEENLYIFVVTKNNLYAEAIDLPRQTLEEKIKNLCSLMCSKIIVQQAREMSNEEFHTNFMQPLEKTLLALYSYLIEPVEFELAGVKQLGIVPNGILHYLPFSVLMFKGATGKVNYLIEKYEIFVVNSTTNLQFAMQKGGCEIEESKLIAFGNADGTLKCAEMEVQEIEHILPKARVYILGDATKEKAKEPIGECSILHFATHGILNGEDATASYIVLAPVGEKGRLTVKETWGLNLKNCQLVTLSSCQTALGELIAGDEIINLAGAFIYAGTPTVMATLWQVDDEMTTMLMKEFYTQLKSGKTKTECLRQAQLSIIGCEDKNFSHPFFWAPFILIGYWR